ncbi:MAG: AIR synthase-related protein [Anaeromyxobacteraceae bacterium]
MSTSSTTDPRTLPEPPDLGLVLFAMIARPRIAAGNALVVEEAAGAPQLSFATFRADGDVVALLGPVGAGEVGGSEYLALLADGLAQEGEAAGGLGEKPAADPAREKAVQLAVHRAVGDGLLSSAHACSAGGLGVALAACATERGAALRIPFVARKDHVLFGEEPGRILVSFPRANLDRVGLVAKLAGVPLVVLGAVGGPALEIQSALSVQVAELAEAWREAVRRRDVGDAAQPG